MANGSDTDPVTKTMLNEAVDAILKGMNRLVEEVRSDSRTQVEILRGDINKRFDNLGTKVTQANIELKDEIDGLKADLSATASRSDLEGLKSKLNLTSQFSH